MKACHIQIFLLLWLMGASCDEPSEKPAAPPVHQQYQDHKIVLQKPVKRPAAKVRETRNIANPCEDEAVLRLSDDELFDVCLENRQGIAVGALLDSMAMVYGHETAVTEKRKILIGRGWKAFEPVHFDSDNGFHALTLINYNQGILLVAFAGSFDETRSAYKDMSNVWAIERGELPAQYADALAYTNRVLKAEAKTKKLPQDFNLLFVGHSLGGFLAEMLAVNKELIDPKGREFDVSAVTFESLGSQKFAEDMALAANVTFEAGNFDVTTFNAPESGWNTYGKRLAVGDRFFRVDPGQPGWISSGVSWVYKDASEFMSHHIFSSFRHAFDRKTGEPVIAKQGPSPRP